MIIQALPDNFRYFPVEPKPQTLKHILKLAFLHKILLAFQPRLLISFTRNLLHSYISLNWLNFLSSRRM